jgi:hypothetical protein
MPLTEQSQNPGVPAVQGIADTTSQGAAGVGVFGCVGLPDSGLSGAPALSFVGVYGSTVAVNNSGIGVYGASSSGVGVYGYSANGVGVQGETKIADAVNGLCHSNQHAGVAAHNDGGGAGLWAIGTPAGYFVGEVNVTLGITVGSDANVTGAISAGGDINVKGAATIGKDVTVTGGITVGSDVTVPGTIMVGTDIVFSNAADFAEDFDLSNLSAAEPGTVMVLGEFGRIEPSQCEYDRKVAGVISGAGDYKPGLILDRRLTIAPRGTLALVGKVYCKVDATYGAVRPGDLLTTSPTSGHAMRADDRNRAFGSVIGKALGTCESGRMLLPILIALQ